jgi:hypothetical protein
MIAMQLNLENMGSRHPGLTEAVAACYSEAARVCLDRHHRPPIDFAFQNGAETFTVIIPWEPADDRTRRAWANEIDTTESGAYGCALATVERVLGLVAIGRAETLTGADYYIGSPDADPDDLEGCFRLEVSGTNQHMRAAIARTLREKVNQAASGKSSLPAIAIVIGFSARVILVETVNLL